MQQSWISQAEQMNQAACEKISPQRGSCGFCRRHWLGMGKVLPIAGVVVNKIDGRRADHAKTLEYLRGYVKEADIPIVGEPIPMLTDISKLTNVGMGLDEHPRPTGRIRNLHENFVKILNATGGEAK